jgi:TPR repeat protein
VTTTTGARAGSRGEAEWRALLWAVGRGVDGRGSGCRDHVRALQYYERAALAGDRAGNCAAAAMYMKGEGTVKNHTRAVELYDEAAKEGYVR